MIAPSISYIINVFTFAVWVETVKFFAVSSILPLRSKEKRNTQGSPSMKNTLVHVLHNGSVQLRRFTYPKTIGRIVSMRPIVITMTIAYFLGTIDVFAVRVFGDEVQTISFVKFTGLGHVRSRIALPVSQSIRVFDNASGKLGWFAITAVKLALWTLVTVVPLLQFITIIFFVSITVAISN